MERSEIAEPHNEVEQILVILASSVEPRIGQQLIQQGTLGVRIEGILPVHRSIEYGSQVVTELTRRIDLADGHAPQPVQSR